MTFSIDSGKPRVLPLPSSQIPSISSLDKFSNLPKVLQLLCLSKIDSLESAKLVSRTWRNLVSDIIEERLVEDLTQDNITNLTVGLLKNQKLGFYLLRCNASRLGEGGVLSKLNIKFGMLTAVCQIKKINSLLEKIKKLDLPTTTQRSNNLTMILKSLLSLKNLTPVLELTCKGFNSENNLLKESELNLSRQFEVLSCKSLIISNSQHFPITLVPDNFVNNLVVNDQNSFQKGEIVAVLDGFDRTGSDQALRFAVILETKTASDGSKKYLYSMQYSIKLAQWIAPRSVSAGSIAKVPLSDEFSHLLPKIS